MQSLCNWKRLTCIAVIFCFAISTSAQEVTTRQFREDFEYFWKTIKEEYAYWDKKQTDWDRVRHVYGPMVDTLTTRTSFVHLLEKVFYELYDHHASLSTNTMESQRLVPSGADIWAEYIDGRPVVTEVRMGFGAYDKGMHAGMEIVRFNDVNIETAISAFLPATLKVPDKEARDVALRLCLAGNHSQPRKITVREGKQMLDFFPDAPVNMLEESRNEPPLASKIFQGNIGYIKINNQLGNNEMIPFFDSVLRTLKNTRAMILDLRETPGGGNTTVARSILGSFITRDGFYQKHELPSEERSFGVKRSWLEIVSPKKYTYTKPLVILVDHWTGSVGEGITIGFDALKRAKIIGTPMAGLNGAIYSFNMPNSGIGFNFPCEKLFHVNGSPRENFKPAINVDLKKQSRGQDMILDTALKSLAK